MAHIVSTLSRLQLKPTAGWCNQHSQNFSVIKIHFNIQSSSNVIINYEDFHTQCGLLFFPVSRYTQLLGWLFSPEGVLCYVHWFQADPGVLSSRPASHYFLANPGVLSSRPIIKTEASNLTCTDYLPLGLPHHAAFWTRLSSSFIVDQWSLGMILHDPLVLISAIMDH